MDVLALELREKERELWLATLYAPVRVRPALVCLFALDRVLAEVVDSVSDPMVGAIRLAWWREALEALDKAGRVPDEPHLQAVQAELLPLGVCGAELAGLEERWGCRLTEAEPEAEHAAEADGGALLFRLAGRILGGNEAMAAALGRGWAAGVPWEGPVPAALRPLLGLAVLGLRDARDAAAGRTRAVRGGAGRQLRMLWAVASGW